MYDSTSLYNTCTLCEPRETRRRCARGWRGGPPVASARQPRSYNIIYVAVR